MKRLFLISLFVSFPALSQTHEGFWLFYDLKLNEKFLLNIKDPMRGSQYLGCIGKGIGGRYFQPNNDAMTSTCRLMIDGRRFALTDGVGNSVFMEGDFNPVFTELSGLFNDGSKFVASKQNVQRVFDRPSVYQVIYNGGVFGELAEKHCERVLDDFKDRRSKFAISLRCQDTGGIGGVPSRYRQEVWGRDEQKGFPANWLVKPNTFLDYQKCEEAMHKVLEEHKCRED
jgi:hypothetical protein